MQPRNPYEAPGASQEAVAAPAMDVSGQWSVELAVGRAFTVVGSRTGLLALLALPPALLATLNLFLDHELEGALAASGGQGIAPFVLLGLTMAAMVVLGGAGLVFRLVAARAWMSLLRGEERIRWPSVGGLVLQGIWVVLGQVVVGTVLTVGLLLLLVPGLLVAAATHVWFYAVVDGDDLVEALQRSWRLTRHGWARLLAWGLVFYGFGALGSFLGGLSGSLGGQLVLAGLFTFLHGMLLGPADAAIYVQMRRAQDAFEA